MHAHRRQVGETSLATLAGTIELESCRSSRPGIGTRLPLPEAPPLLRKQCFRALAALLLLWGILVPLLDTPGVALGLTALKPSVWSGSSYTTWNETIAAGQSQRDPTSPFPFRAGST